MESASHPAEELTSEGGSRLDAATENVLVLLSLIRKNENLEQGHTRTIFFKFVFINRSNANQDARPMCIICGEKLANESLKPAKLERHLNTCHGDLNCPLSFFRRKTEGMKLSAQVLSKNVTNIDKLQLTSYMVSYCIAKEKAPHTIAEKLILPSVLDMVSTVIDQKSADKLKQIPLGDNSSLSSHLRHCPQFGRAAHISIEASGRITTGRKH